MKLFCFPALFFAITASAQWSQGEPAQRIIKKAIVQFIISWILIRSENSWQGLLKQEKDLRLP